MFTIGTIEEFAPAVKPALAHEVFTFVILLVKIRGIYAITASVSVFCFGLFHTYKNTA